MWGDIAAYALFGLLAIAGTGVLYLIAEAQAYLRMREPRPEQSVRGDVVSLPQEAKATSGKRFAGGGGAKAARRCTEQSHNLFPDIARPERPL
jgi:hypothetical protein